MWDDEEPHGRDGRTGDLPGAARRGRFREGGSAEWADGDDVVPYGDGDAYGGVGREATGSRGPQTTKGRATLVIVAIVAVLATVIACCVAISQAASLMNVDPSRL